MTAAPCFIFDHRYFCVLTRLAHAPCLPDRENHKRLAPVYVKRRELLKTIPKFWPVALMNNTTFAIHVQHVEDQKALLHLTDVWLERDPTEHRAFTLEFVSVTFTSYCPLPSSTPFPSACSLPMLGRRELTKFYPHSTSGRIRILAMRYSRRSTSSPTRRLRRMKHLMKMELRTACSTLTGNVTLSLRYSELRSFTLFTTRFTNGTFSSLRKNQNR